MLDISMPGMNGFEVATCLRNGGSTAALIFLSVYEDEELIQASKHAGGMGYVVKQRLTLDLELAVRAARGSPVHLTHSLDPDRIEDFRSGTRSSPSTRSPHTNSVHERGILVR